MSENNSNKRQEQRLHAFWKVFKGESSWGYLIDLSSSGLKLWLNKEEKDPGQDFSITVHPPKELSFDKVEFTVQKMWVNSEKSLRFNEIGCKFNNLTEIQQEHLNKLIVFFKKYNPESPILN